MHVTLTHASEHERNGHTLGAALTGSQMEGDMVGVVLVGKALVVGIGEPAQCGRGGEARLGASSGKRAGGRGDG